MTTQKTWYLVTVYCGLVLLSGCVVAEKYEEERARSLNFQRLLAQEEKKTGEMDSELRRIKREAAELDARNRELSAQLQAVREQLAKAQEENEALRETMQKVKEETARKPRHPSTPRGQTPKAEAPKPNGSKRDTLKEQTGAPVYHEVKPGDTLFRIARQYHIDVEKIRAWNHLQDDLIEVGQRLVVGYD